MKYKLREMVVTKNLHWPAGLVVEVVKNSDPFCVVKTEKGWMFSTRLNNLEPLTPIIEDVEDEFAGICT